MTRPQNAHTDPLVSALADVSLQATAVLRGGGLLFVNRGFCDLFGYDAPAEALADAAFAGEIAAVAGPAARGGAVYGRRLLRRRDGRAIPVELYARLVPWGDAPALAVALIDVAAEETGSEGAPGDDRYAARPLARRAPPAALRIVLAGADVRCAALRDALAARGASARIVSLETRPAGPAPDLAVLTPAPGESLAPLAAAARRRWPQDGVTALIALTDAADAATEAFGLDAVLAADADADAVARVAALLCGRDLVETAEFHHVQQEDQGDEPCNDADGEHGDPKRRNVSTGL